MLRRTLSVLSIAILVGFVPLAHAGFKENLNVGADPVNRRASGAIGTARNSADNVQYLYCSVTHGPSFFATCGARDVAGTTVTCFTTDPNKVALVSAMTSYSYISFTFDTSGTCTTLLVDNTSFLPPMVP